MTKHAPNRVSLYEVAKAWKEYWQAKTERVITTAFKKLMKDEERVIDAVFRRLMKVYQNTKLKIARRFKEPGLPTTKIKAYAYLVRAKVRPSATIIEHEKPKLRPEWNKPEWREHVTNMTILLDHIKSDIIEKEVVYKIQGHKYKYPKTNEDIWALTTNNLPGAALQDNTMCICDLDFLKAIIREPYPSEPLTWSQFPDPSKFKLPLLTEWLEKDHHQDDIEDVGVELTTKVHILEDEPDPVDSSIKEIKHLATGSKAEKKEIGIMQRSKKYAKPKPRKVPARADVKNKKHMVRITYLAIDYARDRDLITGSMIDPASKKIVRELINETYGYSITRAAFDNYMECIVEDKPMPDIELQAWKVVGIEKDWQSWIKYGVAMMKIGRDDPHKGREDAHKMLKASLAAG
jgi:hypothetical protein